MHRGQETAREALSIEIKGSKDVFHVLVLLGTAACRYSVDLVSDRCSILVLLPVYCFQHTVLLKGFPDASACVELLSGACLQQKLKLKTIVIAKAPMP